MMSASSWERIRVELCGTKIIYYKSGSSTAAAAAEKKDEDTGRASIAAIEFTSEANPPHSSSVPAPNVDSTTNRLSVLFQAAEQKIQTAKEEFNRLASSATGLERKVSSSSAGATPLGVLDLVKENATVSASKGHSGAPTPFCLSIKVKSETKWKLSFNSHGVMMEWLSALTDVIVKSSVTAAPTKKDGDSGSDWEMEKYFIQRRGEEDENLDEKVLANSICSPPHSFFTNAILGGTRRIGGKFC